MSASLGQLWQRCLAQIEAEVPAIAYKTWFLPLRSVSVDERSGGVSLRLSAPSAFHIDWIESNYPTVLRRAVTAVCGNQSDVRFDIAAPADAQPAENVAPLPGRSPDRAHQPPASVSTGAARSQAAFRAATQGMSAPATVGGGTGGYFPFPPVQAVPSFETHLKPDYTFETFIEGDGNRLARGAAMAIGKDPGGTSFNPFLVYGGVGLGKTHIVHAIGNFVHRERRDRRVLYVTSDQFTSQFVRAIRDNEVAAFSAFYRQIDLLIVDDIQFFGGKEKTQEEFFHIFNDLYQHGKQIVLCADRQPSAIAGIEDRLLSRFRWGLTVDIQPPDLETRLAILQHKAEMQGVELAQEVVEFIAERITDNIRQLEGALTRLVAYARLYKQPVSVETARSLLADLLPEGHPEPLEVEQIQRAVARHFALRPDLLSARTRKREVVQARHVAMFLSKEYTHHSLSAIGLRFGGRDHSTVIHGCSAVQNRLDTEPSFRTELDAIVRTLQVAR